MLKRTLLALAVVVVSAGAIASAQENVTLTLRSGERITAELVDYGGAGFAVRVNGQDRQIPTNDVAVIDFSAGSMRTSDWSKLNSGQQLLWLKGGQTTSGALVDIGGTRPLRISFRSEAGERDYNSNEIERIVFARPTNVPETSVPTTGSDSPQGITVSSQEQWTPTGIAVRRGDWVTFESSGEVRIGGSATNPAISVDGVSPQTSAPGSPLPSATAGALVGRVGNGPAFLIGSQQRVRMPSAGQLFLGVNDGHLGDNEGTFQVRVSREGGAIRR